MICVPLTCISMLQIFFKLLGRQLAASASEEAGVREHINYCCITAKINSNCRVIA